MAYKDAPFLEDAVASVLRGAGQSDVYVTTSTPSERISGIAEKNGIPLHVNTGKAGIVGDWQFALSKATTPYVTLVDQDDRYDPDYARLVILAFDKYPESQIVFTNYVEIDNSGAVRPSNRTLGVKRVLLWPFHFRMSLASRFGRRLILRFGNPVCSPAVTYNLPQLGGWQLFDEDYAMSLDWEAWLRMADKPGRFTYLRRALEQHRLHEGTQTSTGLRDGRRYAEDLKLYRRLWPAPIARFLAARYSASYETNS
jgi:glycosyltransferase involved in cell wall biosynthesis